MSDADHQAALKKAIIKLKCEEDHLFFTRYFFKLREGGKFIINWHQIVISRYLQKIIDGEIKNLLINISPGSGKTDLAVVNFMARGLAINPHSRFLHISASDDLALLNSKKARDIVSMDEYQELWPTKIATDSSAQKRWNVMLDDKTAGGVYAVSLGGQITGFRAGRMFDGFNGALIIDDPLKADEAFQKAAKQKANRRLVSTVKSRKARPDTPVIVIMQRLAEDDCTAFIKDGNLDGDWTFLNIPALVTMDYLKSIGLDQDIIDMVDSSDQDDKGRFSYWPFKEPLDQLLKMESGSLSDKDGASVSRFVFASQYMQNPTAMGGNIIKGENFKRYDLLPKMKHRAIYGDTAQKTKERNDYSVFECWGFGEDGGAYLIDLVRGKWEAPDLKKRFVDFWNKHAAIKSEGAGRLRIAGIEDKASGTGLIQDIKRDASIPIKAIQRNTDKLTRVMDILSYIEAGYVYLPRNADFVSDFIAECEAFSADNTHAHDDQIDPMCDAITENLQKKTGSFYV